MSYLKYIKAAESPVLEAWSVNADNAYRQLDTVGRCGFMLEQSVFMRYLFLAYGGALPTPLKGYAKVMQERLSGLIHECENLNLQDNLYIRCANIADTCKRILDGFPIADPIRVKQFLTFSYGSGASYPRIYTPEYDTFYDAFLSYLCPEAVRSGFKVASGGSIPALHLNGHVVDVKFVPIATGYTMNQKVQKVMQGCGIVPNTIFDFLAGYNLNDSGWVSRIAGILSTYSFGFDNTWLYLNQKEKKILDGSEIKFKLTDRINPSSNEAKLYTMLHRTWVDYVPVVRTPFDSLETTPDTIFRRLFISFMIGLRRLNNIAVSDDEIKILSKLIGEGGEAELQNYLQASKTASTEAIAAFKDSVFSEFPEFYLENRISRTVEEPPHPFVRNSSIASLQENLKALGIIP